MALPSNDIELGVNELLLSSAPPARTLKVRIVTPADLVTSSSNCLHSCLVSFASSSSTSATRSVVSGGRPAAALEKALRQGSGASQFVFSVVDGSTNAEIGRASFDLTSLSSGSARGSQSAVCRSRTATAALLGGR